jgi:hypothetical protein
LSSVEINNCFCKNCESQWDSDFIENEIEKVKCTDCKHFIHELPCLDSPFGEICCGLGNWTGIESDEDLKEERECSDFEKKLWSNRE